jgi:hypothetical protein
LSKTALIIAERFDRRAALAEEILWYRITIEMMLKTLTRFSNNQPKTDQMKSINGKITVLYPNLHVLPKFIY